MFTPIMKATTFSCLLAVSGCSGIVQSPLALEGCQALKLKGDAVFIHQCGTQLEGLTCIPAHSQTHIAFAGDFATYQCL